MPSEFHREGGIGYVDDAQPVDLIDYVGQVAHHCDVKGAHQRYSTRNLGGDGRRISLGNTTSVLVGLYAVLLNDCF